MGLTTDQKIAGGSSALSFAGSLYEGYQNRREAKKNRKFQKSMSNTAHQREMADLKKAGLNPLLTGKYGGSSTPSGAMGQTRNPMEGLPQASSAMSALKQSKGLVQAQILNQNSATAVNNANALKIKAETESISQTRQPQINKILQDITSSKKGVQHINEQLRHLREEFKKLQVTRKGYEIGGALLPKQESILKEAKKLKTGFQQLKYNAEKNLKRHNYKSILNRRKKGYKSFSD